MGKIVSKIRITEPKARWIFVLDKERDKIIQLRVKAGMKKVLLGDVEWIVTDSECDVVQRSQEAHLLDILDERGHFWVTDLAHKFGKAIHKRSKKSFDCRRKSGELLPRIVRTAP